MSFEIPALSLVKLGSSILGVCLFITLSISSVQASPPAPVAKTGQVATYTAGDDGERQSGVSWPSPRFVDNTDGTVTDNLTGLVWLKDAACIGLQDWDAALAQVNSIANGVCGLSDLSVLGDWRLPNLLEIFSLIDFGNTAPALPVPNPFTGVSDEFYWSSTTLINKSAKARPVHFGFGMIDQSDKSVPHYVWPVRDHR